MFKIFVCLAMAFILPINSHINLIEESPVIALVSADGFMYKDREMKRPFVEVLSGDRVEILEDYSKKVYKVYHLEHNVAGWVLGDILAFPDNAETDTTTLTAEQLECFVNNKNYVSQTDYLILTEINRQKTHIFQLNDDTWKLINSFDCATGSNTSPTTRGVFEIDDRGDWFYSERLKSGGAFWIRFNGNYLFHSIPMDKQKNIIEDEAMVGKRISSGCIRLMPDDIRWIYDNIPDKTLVVII